MGDVFSWDPSITIGLMRVIGIQLLDHPCVNRPVYVFDINEGPIQMMIKMSSTPEGPLEP